MIDFSALKDYWWFIGITSGVVVSIIKFGYSLREQKLRVQILERDIKTVCADSGQLTVAVLAVLDGLKQQGCNGEVTKAYAGLNTYLATNRIQHFDCN